ncbi:hypothetical protein D9613_010840 [Agrocybe pediades]|uniref:Uncharacterized protein n=1 Tax=Agrocybe pediades TaxID=84607 RepID=A0A8H4QM08_9AGAR|nr:hypothetical protein D9613_010840 [Agrocybe pediades]
MISLDLQKEMWAFMKEPAPLLSRIDVDHQFPSISGLPTSSLFGDDAPLLRDFKLRYEFPENASWLSNLSSMSFPPSLNTEEVLATLRWMPRLEYLSVFMDSNSFNDFYIPPPPVVVFPNLRMLQMHGDIQDTCTILECITPSPDCCLAVEINRKNRAVLDDSKHKQYENALKSYIMPYFSLNPPSSMKFFIDADILVLEHPIPPLLHYDNPWERCFRIMFDIHFLSSSSLIKELIGSPWVPYIKKFQFYAWSIPNSPSGLDNDTVISALGALSSFVTTLHTDDPTLEGLLQRPLSYTSTLFPVLTTLKIDSLWRPAHAQEEPAHHRFLKIRKEIGRPISVLDWGVLLEKPGDLGYFEEHAGLLVKWETWDGHREEYLCGEGHPERHGFESDPYRRI